MTPLKKKVLDDLFLGELSQVKITEKYRISLNTLWKWLQHPEFRAALQSKRQQLEHSLFEKDIPYTTKESRITALARKAQSASAQYEAHPLLREVRPLGGPSLRVKTKPTNVDEEPDETPDDFPCIVNEHFNRDAFESFRGALDDIAKELGHRKTVTEHSGSVDLNERVSFYLPTPEAAPPEEDNDAASSAE